MRFSTSKLLVLTIMNFLFQTFSLAKGIDPPAIDLSGKYFFEKNLAKIKISDSSSAMPDFKPISVIGKNKDLRLIFKNGRVSFNGQELKIGESISVWKRILPRGPRCFEEGAILCVWDDLGLEVGTNHKKMQKVKFVNLYLNFFEDLDGNDAHNLYDAAKEENSGYRPHHVYPGYLELDNVRIGRNTAFSEVQNNSSNKTLRCGLKDCRFPSGAFGDHANVFFELNSPSRNGIIGEISLSERDEN